MVSADDGSSTGRASLGRAFDRLVGGTTRYLHHGRVLWRATRLWSVLTLGLTVFDATARTVLMIAVGQFVGSVPAAVQAGAGTEETDQAWRWFLVVAALLTAGPVVQSLQSVSSDRCSAAYLAYVFDLVADAGVRPRGIAHLDSPESAGRLRAVVDGTRDWSFVMGIDSTWSVLAARLAGVGAIAVLVPWRWWVPFVVAAAFLILSNVFMRWISLAFDQLLQTTGNERRRAGYLRRLLTHGESAKEVRLFGLVDWLGDTYRATWFDAMTELWRARISGLGPVLVTCLGAAVMLGGALALIGVDVVAGTVSLAGAVTLTQASLMLQRFGNLGNFSSSLARNTSVLQALIELRRDLGLPTVDPAPSRIEERVARNGSVAAAEVRLDGVSFGYPTRDTRAVDNVTLHIPAGQAIAIVGVNGAGKSTLIKLLCGLYSPDEGSVLVDGADPAGMEEARRKVAVIFQDFVRYPLSLRDNVLLHARVDDHDREVLDRALGDAGGAPLLDRLEHGWDTILSAEYEDGTDLSGGQWQRVALARALAAVAGGAGVLILDEPTAALDVRAEAALFDRFLEVTRGVTTILVSHRLSSVRHADRIVVLADPAEGGPGIVEDGTHNELMRLGGRYSRLFTLQARRFTLTEHRDSDDAGPVIR